MVRDILGARALLVMIVAAVVGAWGLHLYPVQTDNPFLGLIALQEPFVFQVLAYGYATLWFTTPFFVASLVTSMLAIVVYRYPERTRSRRLPPYPQPESRPTPMLVLGERHFARTSGPAPVPTWLTIPQRGLYTGVLILGAVGTGKTSACMYPYVDQLLRWRARDPNQKIGGLVLEVKGDFCRQVRQILCQADRETDYLEIGLDTGVCYNPLHNDLEPYAVAYAIASLLNNLFGKSKEPFWQQAYTDLLKFVISLRRITDGYTTLAEVYRYIIEEHQIEKNIRALKAQFDNPPDVLAISREWYQGQVRQAPWTLWVPVSDTHVGHPYDAELESYLAGHDIPFELRTGSAAICAERRHRSTGARYVVSSLDRILPFLKPIDDLLRDPTVTEVMVNGGGTRVFVERDGTLEPVPDRRLEPRNLTVAIKNIARACGDEISDVQPILDARLEDGSRVAAMFPPCAAGPALTIRKFTHRYTLEELVDVGAVTAETAAELTQAVAGQRNILISGGTGTGKTTLLNALAAHVPDRDRIILIEETAEIHLDKPNLLRFEARRAQVPLGQEQQLPAVTIADLVRASLRHRPDRILVGEVRGAEAFDLLQALNTGHLGSLSTIHANSGEQALTRLAHCVLTGNVGLPHHSIREAIALAIHLVVHVARAGSQRRVTSVLDVRGYDPRTDRFDLRACIPAGRSREGVHV